MERILFTGTYLEGCSNLRWTHSARSKSFTPRKNRMQTKSHGSPTRTFLEYWSSSGAAKLPSPVIEQAKWCLLDALGCGLFGSRQLWSKLMFEDALEGSSGECTVLGQEAGL